MGYSTNFDGQFNFDKPLTVPQYNQLREFVRERHEGSGFPGLYCQWVPTADGEGLEWNGNEKFYDYVMWLEYLIENFFKPWGITVSGSVRYQGQDIEDNGVIEVNNNVVELKELVLQSVKDVEALKTRLKELAEYGDEEVAHDLADKALLEFINDPEVTELFNAIDKHYA